MNAASNNAMQPTANQRALIVNLNDFEVECAAGDDGRCAVSPGTEMAG